METVKAAGITLAGIVCLVALGFALNYAGYLNYAFFAPRVEQVRHNTFECSQSHTDGLAHELRGYMDQYRTADPAGRAVLADRFKQGYDSYTCGDLPQDIQSFRNSL